MSTPARETSKITIDIPIETKRKLDKMKFFKGIPQTEVLPQAIVDGVNKKYEEVFKNGKKENR